MVRPTLQKSGKREKHSNRVKITLKTSKNHSKASENHSKERENSNRANFTFLGGSLRDNTFVSGCDFHSLWNDFHSF